MLDINILREKKEIVKNAIRNKGVELNLDLLLELDDEYRKQKKALQILQTRKNEVAREVPKADPEKKEILLSEGKKVSEELAVQEEVVKKAQEQLLELMWLVPNIPADFAPLGKSDEDNLIIKTVGEKPSFAFQIKNHREILRINGWADFESPLGIAGERAYLLKGEMVLIEMAIHRLVLHKLRQREFEIMTVPAFARDEAFYGTGHFPAGKDQVYEVEGEKLRLAGTGEVIVNSLHKDEILRFDQLPLLYGAFGPCFRKEAGSAGRDVGGLIRVHQFNKTEQYIICEEDLAESNKWHQYMLDIAEEILTDLELPYQIVECCTGDMGVGKYRMNDIEVWVPSEQRYRETHSCSTLLDWQARRTGIRYRDKEGKVRYCHTLNCTGIATPRVLVPLLEIHQQEDGRVRIPEKLKNYI